MKKINLFLASSNELEADRLLFEVEIYRKCKAWFNQGIFLHLDVWEDLSAAMSPTCSQDEYNKQVRAADVFILLAHTKVGMYTAEEFEQAFGQFSTTQKPFIFTYFKDLPTNISAEKSLDDFKEKLKSLGHYTSPYTDLNHLWNQFNKELDHLKMNQFASVAQPPASTLAPPTVVNHIGRQINMGNNSTYNENNSTGLPLPTASRPGNNSTYNENNR